MSTSQPNQDRGRVGRAEGTTSTGGDAKCRESASLAVEEAATLKLTDTPARFLRFLWRGTHIDRQRSSGTDVRTVWKNTFLKLPGSAIHRARDVEERYTQPRHNLVEVNVIKMRQKDRDRLHGVSLCCMSPLNKTSEKSPASPKLPALQSTNPAWFSVTKACSL